MAVAVLTGIMPTGLTAAIDRNETSEAALPVLRQWTFAQSTTPPAEAVVPPVKREPPGETPPVKTAPAPAGSDTQSQPPAPPVAAEPAADEPRSEAAPDAGILGMVQEWLARANREYQGVVVKQLSQPAPGQAPEGEDAIAKTLREQQEDDARKAQAADAARKSAEAKAAVEAKAAEAKRLAEDRRRAEETRRLADETKRKADEILSAAEKQPTPERALAPGTDTVEHQRREAAKLDEEAKRQDQLRKDAEARRQDEEIKRAEAARAEADRLAQLRRRSAETDAGPEMHTRRTFVLRPEPIVRPIDRGTVDRPELASWRSGRFDGAGRSGRAVRGTAVKRWVARAGRDQCRTAGRRVTPPARYTVKRGDSLWRISKRHYRKGQLYRKIYAANRGSIRNPNLIYPCQRVLVPRKR